MLVKRVATMEEEANILKTPSQPKFAIMLCEMSIEEAYQKNKLTKYFEYLVGLNQDTMYPTGILPLRAGLWLMRRYRKQNTPDHKLAHHSWDRTFFG